MAEQAKTYPQMRREFYEKYQKKIVPRVKMFDNNRKIQLFWAVVSSSLLSILGCLCIFSIFYYHLSGDSLEGALKSVAFFFSAAWLAWFTIKKSFEKNIKSKIMPTVCSCFDDLTWNEGEYYGDNIFIDSCAVPEFTSSTYDDIFNGSYKNVSMDIVEAEYTRGSGKNKTTVFNGVIIKLAMNKTFKGHTVITPDRLFRLAPAWNLIHTTLEDPVFEKKFDVYTDDEVEARYLITPSFMERINNIKMAFKADSIRSVFYQGYLILALSTNKDLFSICSLIKPIDDGQQYFQMYEEIISIIKLIDHFKLDQKTGL